MCQEIFTKAHLVLQNFSFKWIPRVSCRMTRALLKTFPLENIVLFSASQFALQTVLNRWSILCLTDIQNDALMSLPKMQQTKCDYQICQCSVSCSHSGSLKPDRLLLMPQESAPIRLLSYSGGLFTYFVILAEFFLMAIFPQTLIVPK